MNSSKLVPASPVSVDCISCTAWSMRGPSRAAGARPAGLTSRITSVSPTTLSGMTNFLMRGWAEMLMAMM